MTNSENVVSSTDGSPYLERWQQALRVLEGMTEHERTQHFNMGTWGEKTDCGTVACLAGHCALDPWFSERGFTGRFNSYGSLIFPAERPVDFFGARGYDHIFTGDAEAWEDVVGLVKEQIDYLQSGGDPHELIEEEGDELPF